MGKSLGSKLARVMAAAAIAGTAATTSGCLNRATSRAVVTRVAAEVLIDDIQEHNRQQRYASDEFMTARVNGELQRIKKGVGYRRPPKNASCIREDGIYYHCRPYDGYVWVDPSDPTKGATRR